MGFGFILQKAKGCPSCAKVVITVDPGIGYSASAATGSGAQGGIGGKNQIVNFAAKALWHS